ncbi:hypothetical protein San01_65210 [Streptomyces angustmyceticus]|uniref:Uncharacterized protein n=1 Tax=Streptomyces angustmyceticus TaxID=285578 RepID=A0A5J4LJ13_9ACTN|nr:hypothetical protein San01_65210 [Streptomyces angustmyceticus]
METFLLEGEERYGTCRGRRYGMRRPGRAAREPPRRELYIRRIHLASTRGVHVPCRCGAAASGGFRRARGPGHSGSTHVWP